MFIPKTNLQEQKNSVQKILEYLSSPVIIDPDNNQIWVDKRGRKHREDGPAVIQKDGTQEWYQHGKRHRADGPAFIHPDGTIMFYIHDRLHCVDGPSVVCHGYKAWHVRGKMIKTELNKKEFLK